jgi:Uri superfamily endonuclease
MTETAYVYKLFHSDTPHVYVGSTMKDPRFRLNNHRSKLNHEHGAISRYFCNCDKRGLKLEVLAVYEVCDRYHLLAYEQLHINKHRASNQNRTFRVAYPETRRLYCAKRSTIEACLCGGRYMVTNAARHFRTKKHQQWLIAD